nr:endo-1,4-beta-xylanase [Pedobacter frigiditerrae]
MKLNKLQLGILMLFIGTLLISSVKKTDGLKDYYKKYFPIGVAVKPSDLRGKEKALILEHFNSITAENAMKMGPIHPGENRYFWPIADSIVEFGVANKIKVRGHCLVWHAQTPFWLFKDSVGQPVSKQVLLNRMKNHIETVVSRYRGKIYAWDVVNEVIADDTSFYRKSPFLKIAGEDFIEQAFRYAHQADPKAILFYNDYNTENAGKRDKIYKMLKNLLAKGVPIHGVGLQAHWSINSPTRAELEKSIEMFSSLGLQIQFTELDISVYAGRQGGQLITGEKSAQPTSFTPEMEQKQLEKYQMIFEVFRKYKKEITGVTFWNLSDKYSWLDGRGRKNYPLLFDTELKPKKAYYEVIKF